MEKLSFKALLSLGFGIMIGSGVITLTGFGIGYTDTGIFFAYLLSGIFFMFCMLPTLITGVTIPRTSFSYVSSTELLGPKAGGMFLWFFATSRIVMAMFGLGFADYVASVVPGAPKKLVAILVITVFYLLNLRGTKSAVFVQNLMNIALFGALGSFSILGIIKMQPDALTAERLLPFGANGMMQAILIIMFSMGAGLGLLEYGGRVDGKSPQKTMLKAVLVVSFSCFLLFACVGLAGAGVLPYEEVANQPMTYAARKIYGNEAGTLFFVIGGALGALCTTINAAYPYFVTTVLRGVQDNWFPKWLAHTNKHGVPDYLTTFFWLLGVVPIALGADMTFMSNVSTSMALMFFIPPNLGLFNLPKKYPEEWKKSIFYIKSEAVVKALTIVCNVCYLAFLIYKFYSFSTKVLIVTLALCVFYYVYCCWRVKYVTHDVGSSVETM